MPFRDIAIRLPEPEAFSLHKLIVSQRRRNPLKKEKDTATARGMFEYFEKKQPHIKRLNQIYGEFPKGWQKRIQEALKNTGIIFPE
jgi:hypothetical protein